MRDARRDGTRDPAAGAGAGTDEQDVTPPADVLLTLARLRLEPVSFAPVGGFPRWRPGRMTFRVDLTDGSVVKVRRVTRTARPRSAAALVRALADPRMPAPLAMEGRVTVERWVEGDSLDHADVTVRHLHDAADLLADLHGRLDVPGHRFRRDGATGPLRDRTLATLHDLRQCDLLTATERRELSARIRHDLPDRADRGVVHGDLCPGNLVVTGLGTLVSIDNERVRIDFLDQDAARTWTRWPMTPEQERIFVARYREHGRPRASQATDDAWRICATAKSAATLRRTPGTGTAVARALLERLHARLSAGGSAASRSPRARSNP
jgi:thiamine kinase-like enzyme